MFSLVDVLAELVVLGFAVMIVKDGILTMSVPLALLYPIRLISEQMPLIFCLTC
jgi:hypothetical protein